ncbi:outer membrane beta-barrel protein [Pedobacter foliorum]|uniref:outer membrane beta-barrel protein n=1 Tax=Pedobacter foliorum TaxID=2739058 RepID=UPI0015644E5A|nr:outer membrane beta-barrel protein [Pedobacter foliorum]NRF40663.1 outer membrane beta-barrel protein [Pedobacter foliorum]
MKKIILLCLGIVLGTVAHAQKGPREHKGFYLSMGLGPVFGPINVNTTVAKYDMSGTGALFDLKIGGAIQENLILHATLLTSGLNGPKITGITGESAKASDKVNVSEFLLGGGVTYYFMPVNVFVSGSAGLGKFSIDNRDMDYTASTENGFGFQIKVGKEWWVSKKWGLGVAATYGKTSVDSQPSPDLREKLNSNRFGIMFSATLN